MPTLENQELYQPIEGTRKQFFSKWMLIAASGEPVSVEHGLGEVPMVVSLIQSKTADGALPVSADATWTATTTTVTVTSTDSVDAYFQVRAF